VLMKVATIDFHPRAFRPGMAVTTNFGRTVAWARLSGESTFDIIVRISMADYLWCLLAEAGREWGLPPQTPKGGDVKLHLPHLEAPAQSDAMITGSDLEIA
jgi:sarcosine oxidase, subunit gamma